MAIDRLLKDRLKENNCQLWHPPFCRNRGKGRDGINELLVPKQQLGRNYQENLWVEA
jgi:hypothetical protein